MKNYQKIHIWDCLINAHSVLQINLTHEFKRKILINLPSNKNKSINLLNNTSYAKKLKIRVNYARWYDWFKYNNLYMPLWAAMGFCELTNLSLEEMEKSIIDYKQKTLNRISIKNPILPLSLNPTFVSFSSHFCFDGSLPKDGKGSFYSQKNEKQIDNFIEKATNCFGDVPISITKDGKGIPKIRLPRIIGEVCKHLCNFKSFGTYETNIPNSLMLSSKEFKLAILISAIVDEGHLQDKYIQFQLSNKRLTEDIKDICLSLGYECSKVNQKKRIDTIRADSYYFYMKDITKFYQDYISLKKEHPLISLTFKEDTLNFFMNSINYPKGKPTVNSADSRKEKILLLLNIPKTSYKISEETLINPRSIRRLLATLLKENKLKRIKKGHLYYYFT